MHAIAIETPRGRPSCQTSRKRTMERKIMRARRRRTKRARKGTMRILIRVPWISKLLSIWTLPLTRLTEAQTRAMRAMEKMLSEALRGPMRTCMRRRNSSDVLRRQEHQSFIDKICMSCNCSTGGANGRESWTDACWVLVKVVKGLDVL